MEKLKVITINDNETYLRQKSKKVDLNDSCILKTPRLSGGSVKL